MGKYRNEDPKILIWQRIKIEWIAEYFLKSLTSFNNIYMNIAIIGIDNDNDKKNHIFPQISLIFQGNLPAPLKEIIGIN